MDPNANLKEQVEIANRYFNTPDHDIEEADVYRLAELVLALDEWISKGGFLPDRFMSKHEKMRNIQVQIQELCLRRDVTAEDRSRLSAMIDELDAIAEKTEPAH